MQPTILDSVERKSFADMHCSVAQCLEVVGEWWSMLILRDVFLGVTRFDDFQERLGISRNILNQRLNHLVETDVLEKVRYSDHPPRFDYRLTDNGRDLWPVLIANATAGRPLRRTRRPTSRGDPQGLRPHLQRGLGVLCVWRASGSQRRPRRSFASHMGPASRWFCQWHGTTPVASYGTTLRVHRRRPKRHSAGPPKPMRRRPHGVQGGHGGPDQRGAPALAAG